MRSILVPLVAASVASLALTGCATKKYVGREVGEINQKVDALSGEMEKTQERVKRNEVRIDDVDKQSQAGISDAKGSAQTALKRATEAERAAKGKLIYTVTLSNDKVTFPVNRAAVSPDARTLVDEAIAQLKAENRGVYFEIEGHTDSSGSEAYNEKLGLETEFTVNRKEFGLVWNAALETGGFLVGDDVKIALSLQAAATK